MDASTTIPEPDGIPADPMDRAPEPGPRRRPAGLLWASALAVVVILVAGYTAVRNPGPASPGASAPLVTDPNANPLLQGGPSLVGQRLPDIVVDDFPLDVNTPSKGKVRVADLTGKPLVINLWATYCEPCVREMPAFQSVHRELGDRVAFLGIDVRDGEAEARFRATSLGITYPLARDASGASLVAIGGTGLPVTVVLDDAGIVRFMRSGEVSADDLRTALDPLLT